MDLRQGSLPVAFQVSRRSAFRLSCFVTIVVGLFKFPPPGSFKFGLDGEGRPKYYARKEHAIIETTKMMTMWHKHIVPLSFGCVKFPL